jgi:hypothetical protein
MSFQANSRAVAHGPSMAALIAGAALLAISAPNALAQQSSSQYPPGSAAANYISVMSKAGTPTPRPAVPVRYVHPPRGAWAGYNYYYRYPYGYYNGASYAYPSYSYSYTQRSSSRSNSAPPGYETSKRR